MLRALRHRVLPGTILMTNCTKCRHLFKIPQTDMRTGRQACEPTQLPVPQGRETAHSNSNPRSQNCRHISHSILRLVIRDRRHRRLSDLPSTRCRASFSVCARAWHPVMTRRSASRPASCAHRSRGGQTRSRLVDATGTDRPLPSATLEC